MFDSLADQIREDNHQAVNSTERAIRMVVVLVLAVLLFAGLWFGIRMLEG
jgi:hypothetical protein